MKIFSPTISGSSQASGSLTISGSLNVSQGITGSLFGTASWATNVVNGGGGGSTNTGSLLTTASVVLNTITFTKGDGSTFPITVNTGSGGGGSVGTLAQVTALGASTTTPITASIISASSFTGSLFGTSSRALSASNAINADKAATIDVYSFSSPVDSYLLMSNVIATTGVSVGGDTDLRYNASTNTLTAINISATNLTGSLFGTSSWASSASNAINARTASFINNLNQNLSITGAVVLSGSSLPELRVIGDTQFTGSINSLNGYTGSLFGTSSWATNARTASFLPVGTYSITSSWATNALTASLAPSYVLTSVTSSMLTPYTLNSQTSSFVRNTQTSSMTVLSSSFASTSSFVNTLNQNILITGNLTVGAASIGANENTLILGLPPAGGTGEGGQLLFQASGGVYTSASMLDNYQNQTRLLRGTNAGSDAVVASWNMHSKQMQLPAYNSTTAFTSTPLVGILGFDANGYIITTNTSSGGGGGGVTILNNTDNYLVTATGTANTLNGESNLQFNGSSLTVTGNITASGTITAQANGQMYFRGGDDAELWDINVANTLGIYGQQNADRAGLKLGSSGPTLFGSASRLGIGTITPTSASLTVDGNVWATSFTGSLFGTASHAITASYALSSAGGGGSFSLAGATDVSFSALADGDLIRYNGIAGKWQNTNLGLTLTPSLSMDSTFYFPGRATIVNYSSYSLASVFAEVKVGSTLIASNSQVTKNGSLLTWNDSSALTGSRTLYVQVQDFGDVASEIVTASYARELATFRYFRFYPTASTNYTLVGNWRLYTSASQTGTSYPATMTNSGSPAPYFATASYFYPGYEPWKAFDNNTAGTGWWNLSAPNYSNTWLQIDLGSEITIYSIGITYGFNSAGYAGFTTGEIYGSNSSSFETGQIKIASFAGQVAQTLIG